MALKVVIGNEYGNEPTSGIVAFCGEKVINELMAKPFIHNGRQTCQIRVNFDKQGKHYYVLKSKNNQSVKYMFHVYEYI